MIDHLQATYHDLKTVKTRNSLQIVLEMPIEALTDVVSLLGPPSSAESVWVVLARLRPEAIDQGQEEPPAMLEPPANDDRPGRPLSQVSAFLCTVVAFRRFLGPEGIKAFETMPTEDQAADYVRESCGVRSRAEFDTDESAAANFRHLRSRYNAWMRAA